MKIKLLFFSMLMAFSLHSMAQFHDYSFGIKVAPSLNWVSSYESGTYNNSTLLGCKFGLVAEAYFIDHLAVVSGLSITSFRSDYLYSATRTVGVMTDDVLVDRRMKVVYFGIPVMAKYTVLEKGAFKPYVLAGAEMCVRARAMAKDHFRIGVYYYDDAEYVDARREYRPFMVSLNGGAGVEYELIKNLSAFAQVVYYYGTDIASSKYTANRVKPRTFALELGLMF